jgi:hypothetical protein
MTAQTTSICGNLQRELEQCREELEAVKAERDALKRDIACVNHLFSLPYAIRDALGWNSYTSLDIMPDEVKRLRKRAELVPELLMALNAIAGSI